MDWENYLEKNPIQKIEKTVKIRVKLPHVNKKPLPRNRIFVQTAFCHSTLKLERKKFTPQNHSLFRSISCFGVTKITTPIWLQKSWKCVKILKKNIAGQVLTYNSKNFHWLNKQLDLERTMGELGKPFLKKIISKENQNSARENKKPLVRYVILILTKI